MKFTLRGENTHPERVAHMPLRSAVAGVRCDEIVLDLKDFRTMREMLASGSEVQRSALQSLIEHLMCRFVPEPQGFDRTYEQNAARRGQYERS